MIVLVEFKDKPFRAQDIKVGDIIHLKILRIEEPTPGGFYLQVEDVTPLPGAEIGYACHICGLWEEAKDNGSLPDGWTEKKFKDGSFFLCADCKDTQVCRVCGCTKYEACQTLEGPCSWVEPDLCSACVERRG